MTEALNEIGFDSRNGKVFIVAPSDIDHMDELSEKSTLFINKLAEFQSLIQPSVRELVQAADEVEHWKQLAIGQRHLVENEMAGRERKKQALRDEIEANRLKLQKLREKE